MEKVYYTINEKLAKQANDMMSFRDYKIGSKTAEYQLYVKEAYDLADKIAEVKPEQADKVYGLADCYAKKLAENMNKASRIGCMCPSVMISGPANFPIHKKEKQNAAMSKNYIEFQKIQEILDRMENILYSKEQIRSGNNDVIRKLEEKLENLKANQEKMKAVNTYYRKNKTLEGCSELTEEEKIQLKEEMSKDWHIESKPFASYTLRNNNQNIHIVENRLKQLKDIKEKGTQKIETSFFKVVENTEIMRLQLFFDNKPEAEIRDILKKHGFKWSPKNSCWQRQLTNNAKYALSQVNYNLCKIYKIKD